MDRFHGITAGSRVVIRPWLQAFGWRTPSYSPAYVHTQVVVAREKGGMGYLFWNARNDYSKVFPAMSESRMLPSPPSPQPRVETISQPSSPPPPVATSGR
jgi:hypothetical protein